MSHAPQPPLCAAAPARHRLSLEAASFRYGRSGWLRGPPPPTVLHGVDLSIASGRTVGLVGESGSGKSTIARLLLGLVQPGQGRVLLDGQPLLALSRMQRARTVQMVFQDPYSTLNPRATVGEILESPLRVHRLGDREARRAEVRRMMDAVALLPVFAGRYPRELSGGQRQRVAIARALMLQPRIVVCDEPTSALDVSVQSQILNLLLALQRDLGLGYLFISHNLAVVQHVADEIVVLQGGRVVEHGPARSVYFEPQHAYTRQLIGATLLPLKTATDSPCSLALHSTRPTP